MAQGFLKAAAVAVCGLALTACAGAGSGSGAGGAGAQPGRAAPFAMDQDYTREGKPQFGEAASAIIAPDRVVIRVLVAEGKVEQADYALAPGFEVPAGAVAALGLTGAGWRMQGVAGLSRTQSGLNGLCGGSDPQMVFQRLEPSGTRLLAGYVPAADNALTPAGLCPVLRFLP